MKKILLMATALFFVAIANAQLLTQKSEPSKGSSDTTWSDLSGQLTRKKVSNGNVLIHTVPGKYDLYASYKSKKVTGYYAIDAKGKKLPVSIVARPVATSSGKFKCYICVKVCNEVGKCAQSCTEDPCPDVTGVVKTVVKTAH